MVRFFGALALLGALAACGGSGNNTAPRNLDNACSILQERPGYARAFKQAERKWGVPVHVQMAAMYQESKFKSHARTPFRYAAGVIPIGRQSSAFGYGQALDGTWEEYQQETGRMSARRSRINDATDFMGWYMSKTIDRNGVSPRDARNQYLAYHEGHSGFARGTYNSKAWLQRVANNVDDRSRMYAAQLRNCNVRGL